MMIIFEFIAIIAAYVIVVHFLDVGWRGPGERRAHEE